MLPGVLYGLGFLACYYAATGPLAIGLLIGLKAPTEVMRKALHVLCVGSLVALLMHVDAWYEAALAAAAFALILLPILSLLRRFPRFARLLAERRKGEFMTSILAAYFMFAALTAVFWGLLGEGWKFVIFIAVAAWGFGDAAAALVGKRFGRHYIQHRMVEGRKTMEGTSAMYVVSGLATFAAALTCSAGPWYVCIALAAIVAPVCALVELLTRRGMDTITVPFSAALCAFGAMSAFSALGM